MIFSTKGQSDTASMMRTPNPLNLSHRWKPLCGIGVLQVVLLTLAYFNLFKLEISYTINVKRWP